MSYPNQAYKSHFVNILARVDPNKKVGSQSGDPLINLYVKPT